MLDFKVDLELTGSMLIGEKEQKTTNRIKNMDDFGRYINAIGIDYDSKDVTSNGYVYKLKKPQFKTVKRSVYAKGTNCLQKTSEYHGQNCYIPTKVFALLNVIIISLIKIIRMNF